MNLDTVVMRRRFDAELDWDSVRAMASTALGCMDIFRAEWEESFFADSGEMLCCFRAPDAESIRQLARGDGAAEKRVWPAHVHDTGRAAPATVIVERSFDTPVVLDELQALEDAVAWCLDEFGVTFLRTYISADGRSMICIYEAPDAEAVRHTQDQGGLPYDQIWACTHILPEQMFPSR